MSEGTCARCKLTEPVWGRVHCEYSWDTTPLCKSCYKIWNLDDDNLRMDIRSMTREETMGALKGERISAQVEDTSRKEFFRLAKYW